MTRRLESSRSKNQNEFPGRPAGALEIANFQDFQTGFWKLKTQCKIVTVPLPNVKVKLGRKEFDVDSERIDASDCGVSHADCVAFAARMRTGEISRVKILNLVSFFVVWLCFSR